MGTLTRWVSRGVRAAAASLGSVLLAGAGAATGSTGSVDFTAVSFNVGTTTALPHDLDLSDGYGSAEASLSSQHYGNGLAWLPAIEAARGWFETHQPEIVGFQEIFDPTECASIPASAWPGFVCESWLPGDPLVIETVLGPGYQIACHLGRTDKCVAVRSDFGSVRGCVGDLCLDGLDGVSIAGCGSGSRVARARIDLANGGEITLAHIHGKSGILRDDADCRILEFEQLFLDFDGTPAADGVLNLVMGDFNTDPHRLYVFDESARRLTDFVGPGLAFDFLSPSGALDPPTYQQFITIDHVASDSIDAVCEIPGQTPGLPPVMPSLYFDHDPVVCVPEAGGAGVWAATLLGLMALARGRDFARPSAVAARRTGAGRGARSGT